MKAGKPTGTIEASLATKRGELRDNEVTERRYLTHDATVEKLGELLPRIRVACSSNVMNWLAGCDRWTDRAVKVTANSILKPGTERGATLSIVSAVAPCIFHHSRYQSLAGSNRASYGAISVVFFCATERVLMDSCSASSCSYGLTGLAAWRQPSGWPNKAARNNRLSRCTSSFEELKPEAIGATIESGEIPYLRFAPAAQTLFDGWRDELERRLRSDTLTDSPAFESHLAKYRSLMPALALVFHLIDAIGDEHPGMVSEGATRLAAAWCEYLELHARKVYDAELRGDIAAAHLLWRRSWPERLSTGIRSERFTARSGLG